MRLPALTLLVLPLLFSTGASAQATLNKCTDAEGRVTYSNLPCRNAAAVRRIEIDPPPPVPVVVPPPVVVPIPTPTPIPEIAPAPIPAPASIPAPAPVPQPAPAPVPALTPAPAAPPATPRRPAGITSPAVRSSVRQCDALTEQLGRVFDKMDQARSKGTTQKQMDAWGQEIKALEQKKQQSGCF
jgi:outer membrane biosynthesis protein TonB